MGSVSTRTLRRNHYLAGSAPGVAGKLSARRSAGNHHAHNAVTANVPIPPKITAGAVPNQPAVIPDSNCPSSFDAPMNIMSTAFTRPRIWSGVATCTNVTRITTLTISAAPVSANATNDTMRLREIPNTIVKTPKAATHHNIVDPTRRLNGRYASRIAIAPAPTAGALRSNPSPHGPVCKISCAYAGSSATAPPSSTANKSSEIEPNTTFCFQI